MVFSLLGCRFAYSLFSFPNGQAIYLRSPSNQKCQLLNRFFSLRCVLDILNKVIFFRNPVNSQGYYSVGGSNAKQILLALCFHVVLPASHYYCYMKSSRDLLISCLNILYRYLDTIRYCTRNHRINFPSSNNRSLNSFSQVLWLRLYI